MSHLARSWRFVLTFSLVVTLGQTFAWGEEEAREADARTQNIQAGIDRALAEPTELEVIEAPLADVLYYFADRHAIDFDMDAQGLKDAGATEQTPLTRNIRGTSLQAALNLILEDMRLAWIVEDKSVLVTSPAKARAQSIRRVYDVSDLIGKNGNEMFDAAAIAGVTRSMVEAADCGEPGFGDIQGEGNSLVVTHNRFGHELIAALLADLRAVQAGDNAAPASRATRNARPVAALDSQCMLQAPTAPLSDVAEYLSLQHEIPIVIDRAALKNVGITTQIAVAANFQGMRLQDALESVLDKLQLTWRIDNEMLQITSKEVANREPNVQVYGIADLLAEGIDPKKLIEAIEKLPIIADQKSSDEGDQGTIRAVPGALVICQTDLAHRQIEGLLNGLRPKADKE